LHRRRLGGTVADRLCQDGAGDRGGAPAVLRGHYASEAEAATVVGGAEPGAEPLPGGPALIATQPQSGCGIQSLRVTSPDSTASRNERPDIDRVVCRPDWSRPSTSRATRAATSADTSALSDNARRPQSCDAIADHDASASRR